MPRTAPRLSPAVAGAMLGLGLAAMPSLKTGPLAPLMPITGAQAETPTPPETAAGTDTDTSSPPDAGDEAPTAEADATDGNGAMRELAEGVENATTEMGAEVGGDMAADLTETAPEATAEIADAWLTAFGLAMLDGMAANGAQNHLISPLGLASVLAMLADGAQGETAAGYATGLGLPADAALGAVAGRWQAMAAPEGAAPGPVTLQGASGLWLAPDFGIDPDYVARQQAALGAELATVDFADPAVLDQLNTWFAERTGGMIPQLLDNLPADTRIVLGNALYLNAPWQTAFDAALTQGADFTAADGTVTEVQLMQQEGHVLYRAGSDHQAAMLPFADPDYALVLYLPAEGMAPEALLTPGGALADPAGFRPRKGMVELPRLDLRAGGDMTGALRAIGMLEGGDHGGLTAEPLIIDQVVHQVALRLDETGAEAAAATAAVGVRSAMTESFHLRADRPFVLAIRHLPSATPLFIGVIHQP